MTKFVVVPKTVYNERKADTGDETRRQEQRVLTLLLAVMGGPERVWIAGLRSKGKDLTFSTLSFVV